MMFLAKGVIRIRKSKNRQHNVQKKKFKGTNNDLQNIHVKLKIKKNTFTSDDGQVTEAEFLYIWKDRQLGDAKQAARLFHHADTDKDNVLTQVPDLSRVFYYFDQNRKSILITHYTLANVTYLYSLPPRVHIN